MPRYFTAELLRRLRNEIPMDWLIQHLQWPHKRRHGQFAFVCPACNEFNSDINPHENLGRCFVCKRNFNPIEFTMLASDCGFVNAVNFLKPHLPAETPAT